jgi:hypothetical protein
LQETSPSHQYESPLPNIVSLKSQASNVRDQLRQEEKALEDKVSTIKIHISLEQ